MQRKSCSVYTPAALNLCDSSSLFLSSQNNIARDASLQISAGYRSTASSSNLIQLPWRYKGEMSEKGSTFLDEGQQNVIDVPAFRPFFVPHIHDWFRHSRLGGELKCYAHSNMMIHGRFGGADICTIGLCTLVPLAMIGVMGLLMPEQKASSLLPPLFSALPVCSSHLIGSILLFATNSRLFRKLCVCSSFLFQ